MFYFRVFAERKSIYVVQVQLEHTELVNKYSFFIYIIL